MKWPTSLARPPRLVGGGRLGWRGGRRGWRGGRRGWRGGRRGWRGRPVLIWWVYWFRHFLFPFSVFVMLFFTSVPGFFSYLHIQYLCITCFSLESYFFDVPVLEKKLHWCYAPFQICHKYIPKLEQTVCYLLHFFMQPWRSLKSYFCTCNLPLFCKAFQFSQT
jgi:hypothetical protein